jgi:long-chain acyl-CoA synthetase
MMPTRYRNLVELGEESCRKFAARPLFGTKTPDGYAWLSYGQFQALVDAARGGLAAIGVRAGDRVAIVSNNRIEWAVAAYATYGLGATFVPMYEAQRAEEWKFILADCDAKVVFGSTPAVVTALERMRGSLPSLKHVIGLERPLEAEESYAGLLERGRREPVPSLQPEGASIAGFVYTSGTTGNPKGVMLTHDNLTSNIHAGTTVFPMTQEDRTLSFLPWAHVYGQVIELHLITSVGASTAFVSDLTKLVDELADVSPTVLVSVPRVFNRLYASVSNQLAHKPSFVRALVRTALHAASKKHRGEAVKPLERLALRMADALVFAKVRAKLGGRLRYALSSSASLSLEVAEFIDALGIEVYEGYGLTETSPIVSGNYPGARKLGSVGRAMPGVTVTIDRSVGDDPNSGEIVVHGPNVMRGYYNRPEENATALLADGGFRTGDLGYLDGDAYLHITGRIKEQYKLENGKYVMPSPLEESLKLSRYVLNVMLYGANQPFNVAIVVLDAKAIESWATETRTLLGDDLTTDPSVARLIASELELSSAAFRGFERPAAFLLTLEDFTVEGGLLTPTLKLKRNAVVRKYAARLEALYAERRAKGEPAGPRTSAPQPSPP